MAKVQRNTITPVVGNTREGWRKILALGETVDRRFRKRVRANWAVINLLAPFRAWETARLAAKISKTVIHPSPVFILGHWRSGTTHLHNLLSQDPQFGYLTNIHAIFPHAFICNPALRAWAKWQMPETRPMDRLRLGLYTPQEEEVAMMNLGPFSMYHSWMFPRQFQELSERMLFLKDQADRADWQNTYLALLRKTSFFHDGKRLVLKNPPHTARIPLLLALFPEARFIHIYRDPLQVYGSMKKLYRRVWPIFQLQEFSESELIDAIIHFYPKVMQAYFAQRAQIPEGRLVEVTNDDLSKDPLETLGNIYETLDLGAFDTLRPRFQQYLSSRKPYPFTHYQLSQQEIYQVREHWGFVHEHFSE